MSDLSQSVDYENGVADVLAFLAGDSAEVTRNEKLPGRRSGSMRQIDVVVRGRLFGMADATLVVDCKRWGKRLDVADLGTFLDLVEDVGADVGLLVSTEGASKPAHERARQARGVRLEALSLTELQAWRPKGTVTDHYRIPAATRAEAERQLRRAGFRITLDATYPPTDAEVVLAVFRHYGTTNPPGELQTEGWERITAAFAKAGVPEPVLVSHGITFGGGTPGHRWLEISANGVPTNLRFAAATEAEAAELLDSMRETFAGQTGLPSQAFDVIKPEGWPVQGLFGGWAART